MNIVICDDELSEVERLYGIIHQKCKQKSLKADLRGFTNGQEFLAYIKRVHIDIAFLDIYMQEYHGIAIARELRQINQQCDIIFVTTSLDYAIDAFELKAAHYLVKPVDEAKVDAALLRTRLFAKPKKTINVISDYINTDIVLEDIQYIQMLDKCAVFYLHSGRQIKTYTPLKNIIAMLEAETGFILCHRNIIVNADYAADFSGHNITMRDGFTFAIPQKRYAEVKKQYMDYIFSTMNAGF